MEGVEAMTIGRVNEIIELKMIEINLIFKNTGIKESYEIAVNLLRS